MELHRRPAIIGMGVPNAHQGNALRVINYMHMIVRASLGTVAPMMMLEHPVDVMRDLDLAALLPHQLFHSLPRRIVEIVRVDRGLGAVGLGAEGLHLVAMIPLEVA